MPTGPGQDLQKREAAEAALTEVQGALVALDALDDPHPASEPARSMSPARPLTTCLPVAAFIRCSIGSRYRPYLSGMPNIKTKV